MNNVYTLLPRLTLNRRFIGDFLDAPAPCCALGMIEERKQEYPLLALRPGVALPERVTGRGFELGHSVLGNSQYEIVHFAFEFRGFATYNVLFSPSDPVVCAVLRRMVDLGSYFVLAIGPDQSVTTFRAGVGQAELTGLFDHLARIEGSTTSRAQYEQVLAQFCRRPQPAGKMLEWVCRGDLGYLDLTTERMELAPNAMPASSSGVGEVPAAPSTIDAILGMVDGEVGLAVLEGRLPPPSGEPVSDDMRRREQRAIAEVLAAVADAVPRRASLTEFLTLVAPQLAVFKRLMDISDEKAINALCNEFPGFYRFAKTMDDVAVGIRSGAIPVPR